jgi:hypothetical protein
MVTLLNCPDCPDDLKLFVDDENKVRAFAGPLSVLREYIIMRLHYDYQKAMYMFQGLISREWIEENFIVNKR